jgi:hypothetical protein
MGAGNRSHLWAYRASAVSLCAIGLAVDLLGLMNPERSRHKDHKKEIKKTQKQIELLSSPSFVSLISFCDFCGGFQILPYARLLSLLNIGLPA